MLLQPKLKTTTATISSLPNLCLALGIDPIELSETLSLTNEKRYRTISIPKANGSKRTVYEPCAPLRKVQNRINSRIFKDLIIWPEYLFGAVPNDNDTLIPSPRIKGRDYVSCAEMHCGSKSIFKVDMLDYFNNIHRDIVKEIFEDLFKYPDDVSEALTNLCCLDDKVPQGALTSSYIGCLALWDIEYRVVRLCLRRGLVYTRLIDDITISSKSQNYDFDFPMHRIKEMLVKKDLPINKDKISLSNAGMDPLEVHGIRVGFDNPRLKSEETRRIRAAVKRIEVLASKSNYRTSFVYREQFNQCLGKVNKLSRVGHSSHKKLISRLSKIKPLPSIKDLEIVKNRLLSLKKRFPGQKNSYGYKRSFDITWDRLNLVGRTYTWEADRLRSELKKIRPEYKK